MDAKSKLFVFAKREVFFIFLFMITTALMSFTLGIKVGKRYSMGESGITQEDRDRIESLKSPHEEQVQETITDDTERDKVKMEDYHSALESHIKDGVDDKPQNELTVKKNDSIAVTPRTSPKSVKKAEIPAMEPAEKARPQDKFSGKFTIQLGSRRSMKEAQEFAEGFKTLGYNTIINEVELAKENRGIWYRVSIGVFETTTDSLDYIRQHKSLFQGQDYIISQFD